LVFEGADVRVAAILAWVLAAQDKPPTWAQVQGKMQKLTHYNFTLKGPLDVDGTYEKGAVHYRSGGSEVAGKGGVTHANADGKWTSVSSLIQMGLGGDNLKRVAKLIPAHQIVAQIAQYAERVDGDGVQGFTGKLALANISQLVRAPWLETEDLLAAGGLGGRFAFSCADGVVFKAELQVTGTKVDWTKRHYQGQPQQGQPPPTPPGQNWKLGPDGYWYEGQEKNVAVSVTVELKNIGSARISEDVRGKIGLK
jgi:hypothetical protein